MAAVREIEAKPTQLVLKTTRFRLPAGPGRPRGSLNKTTSEMRALAQSYGPKALATLFKIMETSEIEANRLTAAEKLLDRGYGKSVQMVAGDRDSDPIRLETSMTDVAKLLLLKIGGE